MATKIKTKKAPAPTHAEILHKKKAMFVDLLSHAHYIGSVLTRYSVEIEFCRDSDDSYYVMGSFGVLLKFPNVIVRDGSRFHTDGHVTKTVNVESNPELYDEILQALDNVVDLEAQEKEERKKKDRILGKLAEEERALLGFPNWKPMLES